LKVARDGELCGWEIERCESISGLI
jgi:hypothetical protein